MDGWMDGWVLRIEQPVIVQALRLFIKHISESWSSIVEIGLAIWDNWWGWSNRSISTKACCTLFRGNMTSKHKPRGRKCVSYSTGWKERMEKAALTSSENRLSCLYFSDKNQYHLEQNKKPAGNQCDPPSCCRRWRIPRSQWFHSSPVGKKNVGRFCQIAPRFWRILKEAAHQS